MKRLLFDQNLSPKLVRRIDDVYPDSIHVSTIGLEQALDNEVWEYALHNDNIIVTKDAGFSEFSVVWGFPPKVLWIRRGNCSTSDIELILRNNYEYIDDFSGDISHGVLALY